MERHPDLFAKAMENEKVDPVTGVRYTWNQSESLEELSQPERVAEIKSRHEKLAAENKARAVRGQKLVQIFAATLDDEDDSEPCLICNL